MTVSTLNSDVELVCEAIESFQSKHEKRMIVGIAGPPASGKSTLSEAVINKINHSLGIRQYAKKTSNITS